MAFIYHLQPEEKKQLKVYEKNLSQPYRNELKGFVYPELHSFSIPVNQLKQFIAPDLAEQLEISYSSIQVFKIGHSKGYGVSFKYNNKEYYTSVSASKVRNFPLIDAILLASNDLYEEVFNIAKRIKQ